MYESSEMQCFMQLATFLRVSVYNEYTGQRAPVIPAVLRCFPYRVCHATVRRRLGLYSKTPLSVKSTAAPKARYFPICREVGSSVCQLLNQYEFEPRPHHPKSDDLTSVPPKRFFISFWGLLYNETFVVHTTIIG